MCHQPGSASLHLSKWPFHQLQVILVSIHVDISINMVPKHASITLSGIQPSKQQSVPSCQKKIPHWIYQETFLGIFRVILLTVILSYIISSELDPLVRWLCSYLAQHWQRQYSVNQRLNAFSSRARLIEFKFLHWHLLTVWLWASCVPFHAQLPHL